MTSKYKYLQENQTLKHSDRQHSETSAGPFIAPTGAINGPSGNISFSVFANDERSGSFMGNSYQQAAGSPRAFLNVWPIHKKNRIKKAYYWYELDELLGGLCDLKRDYTVTGFNLSITDTSRTKTKENEHELLLDIQDKIDKFKKEFCLYSVVKDLLLDFFISDSMILYWNINDNASVESTNGKVSSNGKLGINKRFQLAPGLNYVMALSPEDIEDYDNSLGRESLKVKIPASLLKRLNNAKVKGKLNKLQEEEKIPQKYINAVMNNEDYVLLNKEDGDNWVIRTNSKQFSGLANPTMYRIFGALDSRQSLNEGELGVSGFIKQAIELVKIGESITQGPEAGSTKNWATAADISSLENIFNKVSKFRRIIGNHTISIEYPHPPEELFSNKKYESCETKIYRWGGVSVSLYTGQESTYGGGYLSIKRMVAHMSDARELIKEMFIELFDSLSENLIMPLPDNSIVVSSFDENVLKEPTQLLKELSFMFTNGMGDPVTAIKELGRNPDKIKRSKTISKKENDETMIWEPIYVQSFNNGFGGDSENGRPPNESTIESSLTENQNPLTGGQS